MEGIMLMKRFIYVIKDELGIHARPAGMLVKTAAGFDSKVVLSNGVKEADGKRIMAVMAMAVKQGQQITVTIEGPDEDAAAAALADFMEKML